MDICREDSTVSGEFVSAEDVDHKDVYLGTSENMISIVMKFYAVNARSHDTRKRLLGYNEEDRIPWKSLLDENMDSPKDCTLPP